MNCKNINLILYFAILVAGSATMYWIFEKKVDDPLHHIEFYVFFCWFMAALAEINIFRNDTELRWSGRFILWLISPLALTIFVFTFLIATIIGKYEESLFAAGAIKYTYKEMFLWI